MILSSFTFLFFPLRLLIKLCYDNLYFIIYITTSDYFCSWQSQSIHPRERFMIIISLVDKHAYLSWFSLPATTIQGLTSLFERAINYSFPSLNPSSYLNELIVLQYLFRDLRMGLPYGSHQLHPCAIVHSFSSISESVLVIQHMSFEISSFQHYFSPMAHQVSLLSCRCKT